MPPDPIAARTSERLACYDAASPPKTKKPAAVLTVGVMALVAEEEGRAISARTKAALTATKARGVRLGGDRGAVITPAIVALGVKAVKERSRQKALDVALMIAQIQADGAVSLRRCRLRVGAFWGAKSVQRVLERI